MNSTIEYLIRFLTGEDISQEIVRSIGYTADRSTFHRYNLVIVPSGFFDERRYGTPASLPSLPLREIEGIPLLFGSPKEEWVGDTWVVHADLIASTYFLVTRYEEMIRRTTRDIHGRFPGTESLPFRAGFLHRPVVDEYRRLLRRWLRQTRLRVPDIAKGIGKIYLTHDIDAPFLYRSWKGIVRSLLDGRGAGTTLAGKFGSPERDPYYTFPWIFRQNSILEDWAGKTRCRTVLFFRGGGHASQDKPFYNLQSADMQQLVRDARTHGAEIGLHVSYEAGSKPALIPKEKSRLEESLGHPVKWNRHHFLGCREPEDTDWLEAAGFTDDFTMGYADVAGFRLGTSHPVRWINPVTRRLSPLKLHPLLMMDATLEEKKYMGLASDEAQTYAVNLLEQVSRAGGEAVLLWHNTSFTPGTGSYQRKLYTHLLNELTKK